MLHIKAVLRFLVFLSLASALTDVIVNAEDADCLPIGASNVSLRPGQEEVAQLVTQGFHSRVAKGKQTSVRLSPSRDETLGSRIKRSTNQQAHSRSRSKRSYQVECPTQTNQSMPYNLRSDPNGYPTDLISTELFVRSLPGSDLLFQCLAREVIAEEQGPIVEAQPLLINGTTCPQAMSQLWTYTSVNFGGILCWALANFQEDILFNEKCMGSPCLGCDNSYAYPTFDFNTEYRKLCFPLYRTVSLWAFCPSLDENQRIVRDRIIIPSDCSCTTVRCKKMQQSFNSPSIWDHPFFQH